jgi:hypothetical protein
MALLTNINGKFSVSDAGAVTFNDAFTFPTADGTANYVLQTNGNGQLDWAVNGDITGSGTADTVTKFTGAKTIGDGPITFSSNDSTFAGNITALDAEFTNEVTVNKTNATTPGKITIKGNSGPILQLKSEDTAMADDELIGAIEFYNSDGTANAGVRAKIESRTLVVGGTGNEGNLGFFTATASNVAAVRRLKITPSGGFSFGSTSTAYGTSGQVLTSNGNAPPSWQDNAGGDISGSGVAGEVAYFTGTKTIANNAGMSFSNQQIQFDGIGGADGYILPYDENPGYSNMAAGGFGLLFRESYDSYVTNNTYYYKTGGTAQWRAKYTAFGASVLTMLDGKFNFDTAPANTTSPYNLNLSTRMTILQGGNVGIGTTSPTESKLVISGGSTGTVGGGDAGITMINKFDNPDNSWSILPVITGIANTGFSIRDNTDSTDRLVIDGSGNVGIGTNSPNNPLTVAGNLLVTTTVGDGQEDRFKVVGGGSGDDGNVYVYNDTQSATIRLNSGGASYFTNGLMVGYTSGSYKVQVLEESTNTTNIGVYTNIRGAGTNNYAFYADAANGTSTNFGFYGNSGKNAFLGDTGIGTDSPDQKLQVNGSIKIANTNNRLVFGTAGGTDRRALEGDTGGSLLQVGEGYTNIALQGDVGIGVTSPSSKLTVYGGGSTTSTLELRGGAAGNDNATVSTQQSMTFQIGSAGASGRAFVFNKGGLGYSQGTNLASINDSGTFTATGDVVAYSDERLKSDIKTLDGSKVYNMRGVSFVKDNKQSSGVIAQELEKIAPELVNNDSEYKSVAYGNITGYLIEAIKELKAEIEELKKYKCDCKK